MTASVTAIEQSPVVDVLGVGFASGAVKVHDMRVDAAIVSFDAGASLSAGCPERRATGAKVTAMSFRNDGTPHLCVGCGSGEAVVFDLDSRVTLACL